MIQKLKNNLGFTLIELLIVLVILAILAFTVIPAGFSLFAGNSNTSNQIEVMSQEDEASLQESPNTTTSVEGDNKKL